MYAQPNTAAPGLGFWGELLSTALQAGASVYSTKQNTKLQTAQLKAQTEQARQQLENERKARELQAAILQAQPAAPMVPVQTASGVQLVPQPAGGYTVQLDRSGELPSWVLPAAAVGGGALLLVLLLRR
jgi:septal ring-binding cell division protein DamX